ncbi:LD-carboxypeptidase [Ideonella sp. BN130291]|uniref:LD-carboxypeptidase n=1 Tax=Ideonella sp. BN130291 TaxID=3112940 RepID=UPI002E255D9B|nr:LD-carboxypeptidase [Ideonella sp. BN130291]
MSEQQQLIIFSPSGVVPEPARVRRAAKRLAQHGFAVRLDETALARHQRFAGTDELRLQALHRVAQAGIAGEACVALATRGGYGLTRLLDGIDWPLLARSLEHGLRWVGYSDLTALQLAAMAHGAAGPERVAHAHDHDHQHGEHCSHAGGWWHGPMANDDFGREPADLDDVTEACFVEAMGGELEAVGFRTEPEFDGLDVTGRLWGGNLCVVASLLGTPHFPRVKGGVLFLEDVAEHPYRVERMLLQLHQAGVLGAQKAVVLGQFTDYKKSPLDRGYTLKSAIAHLRATVPVPILTGLPFGHVPTKVCLPVGRRVTLAVQGKDAFIGW